MADESTKTVTIKAVDETASAVASAERNFGRLPKALSKEYKQLSNGIVVSLKAVQNAAKMHGRSYEDQLKLTEKALGGEKKFGAAVDDTARKHGQAGAKGKTALSGLTEAATKSGTALMGMAAKAFTVTAALEAAREGFLAFGKFDTNLRRLQNTIGGSRTQIESFGNMFKEVAASTGDDLNGLQLAFKEFIDKSGIKPEDAKKMFPDIALYAKGASASVEDMSRVTADAMRIMEVPAKDYKKVLESIVHVADDLNVNVGDLAQGGTRALEVMSSLGYKGAEGFAKMSTFVGVANKATGNTQTSIMLLSNLMEKMLAGDEGIATAMNMSVQEMQDNIERAKKEGDPVGWMIGMFSKATNARDVMAAVGIRDRKVVTALIKELQTMNEEIEKTKNATGGADKGKNVLDGPEAAVSRLTASISLLVMELGHLLDSLGVTSVIQKFADLLGGAAEGASRLVELLDAIKHWTVPSWWPKSWAETKYRLWGGEREGSGKLKTPWEETPEGKAEAAVEAQKKADEAKKTKVKVTVKPGQGATVKPTPGGGVAVAPIAPKGGGTFEDRWGGMGGAWAKPAPPGPLDQQFSVGQRAGSPTGYAPFASGPRPTDGGVKPMSYQGGGGALIPAAYHPGEDEGKRGEQILSAAEFKKLGKKLSEGQGGYGSSTDAKYLQAAYHPGGGFAGYSSGGGVGGGGAPYMAGIGDDSVAGPPGAHGTGYGGGTALAAPYSGDNAPSAPPTPEGPLKSGGGYTVLPEGTPQAPGGTGGGDAGGRVRRYERRRGERGEFNWAATGALGAPGTNQTTVQLKNGQKIQVNAKVAGRFKDFANDMIDKGYPVDVRGGGGFAMRSKRGGSGYSMHSYGSALDINVKKNPFKGSTTDMPTDVEETAWKHGLSWGGRFGDPMHFEAMSPEAAKHKLEILAQRRGEGAVATAPPAAPTAAPQGPVGPTTAKGAGIRGRTSIAALEKDPQAQASINRFRQAFPNVPDAKTQIYSLVKGESSMGRDMVQKNQYAGYFQLGSDEAYKSMGLSKQQFAALPFHEQMDAYTRWAQRADPSGKKIKNLGLFNAASSMKWQGASDDTVIYPAGSREAAANRSTWGRYSGAGGATTVGGVKKYYGRGDPGTQAEIAAATPPEAPTTETAQAGEDNTPIGQAFKKKREEDAAAKTEEPKKIEASINVTNKDKDVQFARGSQARTADREVRQARQLSHADIGVA